MFPRCLLKKKEKKLLGVEKQSSQFSRNLFHWTEGVLIDPTNHFSEDLFVHDIVLVSWLP